jgi:hypothetical protein
MCHQSDTQDFNYGRYFSHLDPCIEGFTQSIGAGGGAGLPTIYKTPRA